MYTISISSKENLVCNYVITGFTGYKLSYSVVTTHV